MELSKFDPKIRVRRYDDKVELEGDEREEALIIFYKSLGRLSGSEAFNPGGLEEEVEKDLADTLLEEIEDKLNQTN